MNGMCWNLLISVSSFAGSRVAESGAWTEFPGDRLPVYPLGAKAVVFSTSPEGETISAIWTRRYALEMVDAGGITVEWA